MVTAFIRSLTRNFGTNVPQSPPSSKPVSESASFGRPDDLERSLVRMCDHLRKAGQDLDDIHEDLPEIYILACDRLGYVPLPA